MLIKELINKRIQMKKTPAQKIRDYFKQPKWAALTKKQEERHGRDRRQSI